MLTKGDNSNNIQIDPTPYGGSNSYKILSKEVNVLKKTFNITGMTCASCASAVERRVSRLDGVNSANVNLPLEKLTVEFDENILNANEIKDAVSKAD